MKLTQIKLFTSVTSSSEEKINQWLASHKDDYEILAIEPITRGTAFVWDLLIIFRVRQVQQLSEPNQGEN